MRIPDTSGAPEDAMMQVTARTKRPNLDELGLSLGKRVRLHRLLYDHGAKNGTALFLPLDQGLEHGPRDFFPNPDSLDPEFVFSLAAEADYSGVAVQYGIARKHLEKWAGRVPLILKLNGRTEIVPDEAAFSSCVASVEDAVALGADAVGYTLYVGSPAQAEDFRQFAEVRREADRLGMPLICWSYPRGKHVDAKGGRDSIYAIDYAARVAAELGADVVKLNMPVIDPEKAPLLPKPYNELAFSQDEAMAKVIRSAGRTLVLLSGGAKISDADLMHKARVALEAGATGFIFGRNVWQRPRPEALAIARQLRDMLAEY